MAKKEEVGSGGVKKETTVLVAFIALTVGFLGGVVYTSLTFKEEVPAKSQIPPKQRVQGQRVSVEQTERIRALEQATARNPNNVEAWTQLGNLYFDTNRYEKAIMAYKKSLELNPNNANVLTDMGVMYRRSGRPGEAVKAFDKAIEVDPFHEASRFNKGIVLMHNLNDREGAIRAWEDLVKVNPSAKAPNGRPVKEMLEKFKESMKRKGPKE